MTNTATNKAPPDGYILAAEAARTAKVSRRCLTRAIETGKLEAVRAGTGEIYVKATNFQAWLAARNTLTPITPERKPA